jgi:hypothetical protein
VAEPYHNALTDALVGNAERMTKANQDAANGIQSAAGKAGDSLSVTYSDIDALATRLKSHSAFVVTKAQAAAKIAVDGDVLESTALSPLTAAVATAAILNAAGQLTTYIVIADAVALVMVGVVATYRAADAALEVASASLIGIGGVSWAMTVGVVDQTVAQVKMTAGLVYVSALTLYLAGVAVDAAIRSASMETVLALVSAVAKASESSDGNPLGFVGGVVSNFIDDWSAERFWQLFLLNAEAELGNLGGLFPVVLQGLITSGLAWGVFRDGPAQLSSTPFNSNTISRRIASVGRIEKTMSQSSSETTKQSRPFDIESLVREDGTIEPRDTASLLVSAAQIDMMGAQDEAVIRIIKSVGPDGTSRYTVQIPSTLSWSIFPGNLPNDFSSDLYALTVGDQTALAKVVYEAMEKAGINKTDPVMMVGFSLGGITAAAIASGDSGYNIRQVITAGAPIARSNLADGANPPDVISLESKNDPVAILDGGSNHQSENWRTTRDATPRFSGEMDGEPLPLIDNHNALRYAKMAGAHPEINSSKQVREFLTGPLEVNDYYSRRK